MGLISRVSSRTYRFFPNKMLKISRLSLKGNYPRFQQRHPAIMLDMVKNNSRGQFHFQTKGLGEWSQKNERLYKPVSLNRHGIQENLRPAEVYHGRIRIRMSPKNMAHAAWFVRNMNVDEAIEKCRLTKRKSTLIIADFDGSQRTSQKTGCGVSVRHAFSQQLVRVRYARKTSDDAGALPEYV